MKRYEVRTTAGLPCIYEVDGPVDRCVAIMNVLEPLDSNLAAMFAEFLTWRQWRTDPPPENALVLVQYRIREGTRVAPGSSRRSRIHVDIGDVTDDLVGWRPMIPEEQWPLPPTPKEGLPAIDRLLQEDAV